MATTKRIWLVQEQSVTLSAHAKEATAKDRVRALYRRMYINCQHWLRQTLTDEVMIEMTISPKLIKALRAIALQNPFSDDYLVALIRYSPVDGDKDDEIYETDMSVLDDRHDIYDTIKIPWQLVAKYAKAIISHTKEVTTKLGKCKLSALLRIYNELPPADDNYVTFNQDLDNDLFRRQYLSPNCYIAKPIELDES